MTETETTEFENAPDVIFNEIAGLFVASFLRPTAQATNSETPRKHQENTKKPLKNAKETLLQQLRQRPESSVRMLAEVLGMTEASIRHHLRSLQTNNKIRHIGPAKGGQWEIID